MSLNLIGAYKLNPADQFDDLVWNRFVEDIAVALNALQQKSASFDEARQQLIQAALFRVNEILLPAFSSVQQYQTGGFLVAPIADATEVEFVEGATAVVIHPDQRAVFWPSPFVALTRESSTAEWAIAQTGEYNAETGALTLTILAATGGGTHQDVIVSATAGSVMAQQVFLTDAKTARDEAAQWADKAENSEVETGKYSAKHHALKAAASAELADGHKTTASTQAGIATGAAGEALAARDDAIIAKGAAEDAAIAAQTFDPSSYYTKAELDHETTGKADKSEAVQKASNLSDIANAATAFGNIKQGASDSATGVVELATAGEILSGASGALAVTAAGVKDALALTTPSGASNFAPDWSVDGVADWNVTANRTLSNPTNVIPGSTRYVFIRSNSGTPRTITFGSNFKGKLPTLDDVTNAKWYLLALVAYSSTHIVVSAVEASP